MSEEQDYRIQKYLEQTMDIQERQAFEEELRKDQDLAIEVEELKKLEDGLLAAGMETFMEDMRQWEHAGSSMPNWKPYLMAAAVLTVVLVPAIYFLNLQKPSSEELFMANYQPYEEMITQRASPGDSVNTLLTNGLHAYNSGAYKKSAELLGAYLKQNPKDHKVSLYLAIAQLEINQKELAAANFVRAQQDPAVKEQAQWYQALTYLKFQETDSAVVILKTIANSDSHYRKQQASRLLKDLS